MTTKEKLLWKTRFWSNTTKLGGAQDKAISMASPTDVILNSHTTKLGRMWGFCQPSHLLKLLEKNHGLYEVITKFPHKVYFDIDEGSIPAFEPFITQVKSIIEEYFPNGNMAISGSFTPEKASLHIILNNYVIHNEAERTHIKMLVKYLQDTRLSSFDWKVYTKNRNMKCINQSKTDDRVQNIIENMDYKQHCITAYIGNISLPFPALQQEVKTEMMIEKSKATFDLGILPKMILKIPDDIDITHLTPQTILPLLPLNKSFDHIYTHQVARYCYHNKLPFEMFLSWLKQKHPKVDEVASRWSYHWQNMDKFPPVSHEKIMTILYSFYPHLKKDKHFRQFAETFDLPETRFHMIETINPACFQSPNKYEVFNVGMGGGKTAQTIMFLKDKATTNTVTTKTDFEAKDLWGKPIILKRQHTTTEVVVEKQNFL